MFAVRGGVMLHTQRSSCGVWRSGGGYGFDEFHTQTAQILINREYCSFVGVYISRGAVAAAGAAPQAAGPIGPGGIKLALARWKGRGGAGALGAVGRGGQVA